MRPADVHVAVGDAGHQGREINRLVAPRHPPGGAVGVHGPRAGQHHEAGTLQQAEALDLVEQGHGVHAGGAHDDGAVPGQEHDGLQHGAHRGQTQPDADQHHVGAGARGVREEAVRPFEQHPGARADPQERPGAGAGVLEGDAQRVAGRCGRQREGVLVPPQAASEEAPVQELAGVDVELGEAASGHDDADHPRRLLRHRRHHQPVVERLEQRQEDAEGEQAAEDDRPERCPVGEADPVVEEGAERELVGQRDEHGRVAEQVDDVPHLVRQPAPGGNDRRHRDRGHQRQPDHGEHEIARAPQAHDLGHQAHAVGGRVAHDQEHRVQHQTAEHPLAEPGVQGDGLVVPDGAVDEGDPRGQHQADGGQRGGHEAADEAQRGQVVGEGAESSGAPVGEEERDRHGDEHPGGDGQPVTGGGAAASLAAVAGDELRLHGGRRGRQRRPVGLKRGGHVSRVGSESVRLLWTRCADDTSSALGGLHVAGTRVERQRVRRAGSLLDGHVTIAGA